MESLKPERNRHRAKPLLPCHVRQLREHLLSSNSIIDLQTYVIIMVSICLILQFDDFENIELSHFDPRLFIFDERGNIHSLCFRIFGRSSGWTHMTLWIDEECPEFCPVSILLSYIHCSGIKSGFLFPSEEELLNPPDNGDFVTQLKSNIAMTRMNKIAKQVAGLDNFQFQKCTFRRTGYLFGRWGGGAIEMLASTARHISRNTAQLYVKDADVHHELCLLHNNSNHLNKVCTFRPNSLKATGNAIYLNLPSMKFKADLPEAAERYITNQLQIPKSHSSYRSPLYLCTLALRYVRPQTANERLETFLKKVPEDCREPLRQHVNSVVQQGVMAIIAGMDDDVISSSVTNPQYHTT